MAEENSGMSVSKLVVIIIALIILVLNIIGMYNGWYNSTIEKIGSQMDRVLIFFNLKSGATSQSDSCLEKIPISIQGQINGDLKICPSLCELELYEEIEGFSKFKINKTGTYKYLDKMDHSSPQKDGSSTFGEEWRIIEITNPEEIQKEVEASENFNILLNTLKNFLKEINPEPIEEFENVCTSNEDCQQGYYCDSPQNPFFCPENPFEESSLNSQEVLILKEEIIYDGTANDIFLDSKGDLYFIITENYKKDPLSKLKIGEYSPDNKLKVYNDFELKNENPEISGLSSLMDRGKDRRDKLLKLEPCYFKELNNLLINLYFKNYPYSNHYENPYINKNQQEYYCKKIETTPQLNRIFSKEDIYYIFVNNYNHNPIIGNAYHGTLFKKEGENWYKQILYLKEEDRNNIYLRDKSIYSIAIEISKLSKGGFLTHNGRSVRFGQITNNNNPPTIQEGHDFNIVNDDNINEFYNYLSSNITQNKIETEIIKDLFENYLDGLSSKTQKIDLITFEDERMMLTLNDKYGITKEKDRDVLEVDFRDLKLYEYRDGNWVEIDFEDTNYVLNEETINQKQEYNLIIDYLTEKCL